MSTTTVKLAVGLAAALLLTASADARRGRGGSADKARERIDLVMASQSPVTAREARLELRRKNRNRQTMRVKLERATSGFQLDAFVADASGALHDVGDFREKRAGHYSWRVRTQKGEALPFGVADLSSLAGRAFEVRTTAGNLVATGTIPTVAAASASAGKSAKLRSPLAVDDDAASSDDDAPGSSSSTGVKAEIEVRRKSDGREEFKIEIERAAAGLILTAFMTDAAGAFQEIGALSPDDDDDDDGEYRLRLRTNEGDALPLGAATLHDLAGRLVEIRNAAGDVIASGEVPDAGTSRHDDDDDDSDDDEDDDSDDDEDDVDEGEDDSSDDD
jgi:hypothetical protein